LSPLREWSALRAPPSKIKFDGTPLFPERRAYTVNYKLSDPEAALYAAVTEYAKTEFAKADPLADGGRNLFSAGCERISTIRGNGSRCWWNRRALLPWVSPVVKEYRIGAKRKTADSLCVSTSLRIGAGLAQNAFPFAPIVRKINSAC
jgi:hypothetical protein